MLVWCVAAAAVALLSVTLWAVCRPDTRTPAERQLDAWARRQNKVVRWRECFDEVPLADGIVRCEAGFSIAGASVIYCPGELSQETTCRWSR